MGAPFSSCMHDSCPSFLVFWIEEFCIEVLSLHPTGSFFGTLSSVRAGAGNPLPLASLFDWDDFDASTPPLLSLVNSSFLFASFAIALVAARSALPGAECSSFSPSRCPALRPTLAYMPFKVSFWGLFQKCLPRACLFLKRGESFSLQAASPWFSLFSLADLAFEGVRHHLPFPLNFGWLLLLEQKRKAPFPSPSSTREVLR